MLRSILLIMTIICIVSICSLNRATSHDLINIDDLIGIEQESCFVPDTNDKVLRLVAAIRLAENSKRFPYGIKSIEFTPNSDYYPDREKWAKRICINTVKNNVKRWRNSQNGKSYLEFLADRYCPIGVSDDKETNLNRFWYKNVINILKRG